MKAYNHFKHSAKFWSQGKTQNEPPFLNIMYTQRKEKERQSIIDKAIGARQFEINYPYLDYIIITYYFRINPMNQEK